MPEGWSAFFAAFNKWCTTEAVMPGAVFTHACHGASIMSRWAEVKITVDRFGRIKSFDKGKNSKLENLPEMLFSADYEVKSWGI